MPDGGEPTSGVQELLLPILDEARQAGFLGPAPVAVHIAHSQAFARVVPEGASRVADLGSGAGLPGLVLAIARPELTITLVEVSERRADHLRRAVGRLHLDQRVTIDNRPVEVVGRDPQMRGAFDVVVARSFAPPGTLAECAVPLLHVGGCLVVAEPPDGAGARWAAVATSGLPLAFDSVETSADGTFARLIVTATCPDRFPRGTGVPFRRPLFS